MTRRAGFLGGFRGSDAPERGAESGLDGLSGGSPIVRLGDPSVPPAGDALGTPPGFDPIWGAFEGPATDRYPDAQEDAEGPAVEVEIFGNGYRISGQVQTGKFDRLSGWINMQSGFIAVRDAQTVPLGQTETPDPDQRKGTLWVRLDQIVMMAEQSGARTPHPGTPIVQKRRRWVSIATPGCRLDGNLHVHAHGSMTQFLQSPEPHFLPITDVTVRSLSNASVVARFPFAMVNREQLVTVLEESVPSPGEVAQREARSA